MINNYGVFRASNLLPSPPMFLAPIDILTTSPVFQMVIVDLETEQAGCITIIAPADVGLAGTDIWDRDINKALVTAREGAAEQEDKGGQYFHKIHFSHNLEYMFVM